MSKKYIYILIGVVVLAIIVLVGLFLMKDGGVNGDGNLFSLPFGNAPLGEDVGLPTNPSNDPQGISPTTITGQVRQISTLPVSGSTIITTASTLIVRYIDRGTGHVFDYDVKTGIGRRISNTTIPKAQSVVWSRDGESFIMRIENSNSIKDFHARLTSQATSTTEGERELIGSYLVGQRFSIVPSADGEKIFSSIPGNNGSVLGVISAFDGSAPTTIWRFPTKEWNASWPTSENLFLTTKASAKESGYAYLVNTKTGDMTSVLSGITGLIANPHPTLKYVLYSQQTDDRTYLSLIDVVSGAINPVGPPTLAEKCVWSQNQDLVAYCAISTNLPSGLPDIWYQGQTFFDDEIWKLNFETGETKVIANKKLLGSQIDAVGMQVSLDEEMLTFQNKIDLSLWAVMLSSQ